MGSHERVFSSIQVRLTADNETWAFGAEIEANLGGQSLSFYNKAMQINNLPNANVTVLNKTSTVSAETVTIADFLANKYEGQYIALENVQVASTDLNRTFVEGDAHTSINMETSAGESFIVFSSKYSTYGTQTVPQGSGTLKGIATRNNDVIQISFAQTTDWEGLTGTRFEGPDYLTVTPETQSLESNAGTFDIQIMAKDNTAWTITKPEDATWLTLSSDTGTGNATVTVTYEATTANRETTITVSAGESLTATCYVSQVFALEEVTIAEFLAKETGDTYYKLTGTYTANPSPSNARIYIRDNTGEVFIYGVTDFPTEGIAIGNSITIAAKRGEYNGNPQGAGAYYISHEAADYPTLSHPTTDNVTFTGIDGFYGIDQSKATINGVSDIAVSKFGTSKKVGSATFTIPSGTTKIGMYAVGWAETGGNKNSLKLTIGDAGTTLTSDPLTNRATGNSPYTLMAYDEEDYYEFTLSGITDETTVTIESVASSGNAARAIIWGVNTYSE